MEVRSTNRFSMLLTTLGVAVLLAAPVARAQADSDTRHHGYEHGYRDGYAYGRDAHSRGVALDTQGDAYKEGTHGYREEFGPREEYQTGYREGYRMGADDGYVGITVRLEKLFGDEHYVANRRSGYEDVAADVGYRDGLNAGLKDFREHHSFRATEHDVWKEADHGYDNAFGNKEAYKSAYRKAFEAGYSDGFNGRPKGGA